LSLRFNRLICIPLNIQGISRSAKFNRSPQNLVNFLLHGDIFGLFSPLFDIAEYGVETLTEMELHKRQVQAGIKDEDARLLPLTQPLLADTLGMSHVHANRTFRSLLREGLVALRDHEICLLDIVALAALANFHAACLNQGKVPPATRKAMASLNI
jgi:CRP-like cAMP-binding protein